jgi:hypothetical protein
MDNGGGVGRGGDKERMKKMRSLKKRKLPTTTKRLNMI